MTTDTVLTDEQIGDLYLDWNCFFKDNPGSASLCIRAIEQAVLQSEQVQSWRRDAERYRRLVAAWLDNDERGEFILMNNMPPDAYESKEDIDAAIDAAKDKQ